MYGKSSATISCCGFLKFLKESTIPESAILLSPLPTLFIKVSPDALLFALEPLLDSLLALLVAPDTEESQSSSIYSAFVKTGFSLITVNPLNPELLDAKSSSNDFKEPSIIL